MTQTRRTTIALEIDVLQAARERSEATGETLGKVVSDMMRESLETELAEEQESDFWKGVKFLPKRPGQPKVTLEKVNQLRDEEY